MDDNAPFFIEQGFYAYTYDGKDLICNNVVFVPVVQNDEIVFVLSIYYDDGNMTYSGSTKMVDSLNENIQYGFPYDVIYYEDGTYLLQEEKVTFLEGKINENFTYDSVKDEFAKVNKIQNVRNTVNEERMLYAVGYVDSPMNLASTRSIPEGFSIYTNTYKLLQMAYCTCDQKDENGVERNLCWAATVVAMIRYMTGKYRNLMPYDVAKKYGISYNVGASTEKTYAILKDYLTTTQLDKYEAVAREARTITEVHHNINNRFPIALGGMNTAYGANHMVILIGYNGSDIIYCDSQDPQHLKIVPYYALGSGRKTSFQANYNNESVTFYWETSILIPYNP